MLRTAMKTKTLSAFLVLSLLPGCSLIRTHAVDPAEPSTSETCSDSLTPAVVDGVASLVLGAGLGAVALATAQDKSISSAVPISTGIGAATFAGLFEVFAAIGSSRARDCAAAKKRTAGVFLPPEGLALNDLVSPSREPSRQP